MDKFKQKECKQHGLTDFVLEGRGSYRCKKCRCMAVQKRRDKLKVKAVEYLGGCCTKCGYHKCITALEFHHISSKQFSISETGRTRSWEKVKAELDKCVLLCANCHREQHKNS